MPCVFFFVQAEFALGQVLIKPDNNKCQESTAITKEEGFR